MSSDVLDRPAAHVALAATKDILPVAASVSPFALVIGSAMAQVGISGPVGLLGGAGMYSGSAQLAAVNLLGVNADLVVILSAVVVINARLLVYGAALEPRFRRQPWWFRWLGPQFIVDQTYALATRRGGLDEPGRFRRYWLTVGLVLGAVWLGAMTVGMVLGGSIPESSPLNFAAVAVIIIALLAPRLRAPRPILVAGVAVPVRRRSRPFHPSLSRPWWPGLWRGVPDGWG